MEAIGTVRRTVVSMCDRQENRRYEVRRTKA
jgi:hypothetical protein